MVNLEDGDQIGGWELDRYVLDVGHQPPLDADGFLELLSADAWGLEGSSRPQRAGELAGEVSSFVLLAPARAGKSTVLEALRQLEPDAVEVDLRILDLTGIRRELSAAIANGGPVYLDSLDEAAMHAPAVFRVIERHLTTIEARGVSWRLACRPAAWNEALATALHEKLEGFRELRLLPLHREAAGGIADATGADPDVFLPALSAARLGRLASTPVRLRMAAQQWVATGQLPDDPVEAIRFEVTQLMRELDPGRPQPAVPYDRQLRIARRLGAITALCGRHRFAVGHAAGQGVTTLADLPSSPEPDELGTPVTPEDYQSVVETALFDPAPNATLEFRHHEYAEFLAADYLARRNVGRLTLRTLLGVHEDDVVPGSMAGVAVWLTALDPALTEDLVAANALEFARTGVEVPSDNVRAAIIEALLARAAAGDIDPEWGLDLAALSHPRVTEQLQRFLAEGQELPELVWWVAKLATVGGCVELAEPLLGYTLESRWPDWTRAAGVEAVRTLGNSEHVAELEPLLELGKVEDPNDELLADAIEALYPEHLTTTELLSVLRPRRNDRLVGGYLILLGRLAEIITDEALPAALEWVAEHASDDEGDFGRLPEKLIDRGLRQADSEPVRQALAAAVARMARGDARFDLFRRQTPPWADAGEQRRRLAVAVAEHLNSERDWLDLLDLRLVTPDDTHWLLDELPRLPDRAQPALAACIPHLVNQPTVALAERIITLPPGHPAYATTASLRGTVSLDSEIAKRWRRRRTLEDSRDQPEPISAERLREILLDTLSQAEHDRSQWWKITYWLSPKEGDVTIDGEVLFGHDLTLRPGWALLDDDERERVLATGLDYVARHQPEPANWRGMSSVSDVDALQDWSSVYLLTTLTRHDPQRVQGLDANAWTRLAPAIVGAWNYDNHEDAQLRVQLVKLAPAEVKTHITASALEQLDADAGADKPLVSTWLSWLLLPGMAETLADRILTDRYPLQLAQSVLDLLAEHVPDVAVELCRRLRAREHPHLGSRAAMHLGRLDPTGVVDELLTTSPSDDAVQDAVAHLDITNLEGSQLTSLARLLLDHFPYANDPPPPENGFSPDKAFKTRGIRNRLLGRLAELGETRRLAELAEDRSGQDQHVLRRLLRQARASAAELALAPPTPNQLIELFNRADARLVRSDSDLLEVVVDQLDTLEKQLAVGAYRDLWNFDSDGTNHPGAEDDISDWVQRRLQDRLAGGAIVDREVHVARPGTGGIGTRVDLAATTTTATHAGETARISIEAKLVNHPQLRSALTNQLAQRYLEPTGRRHGIYLVYWIAPEQRPSRWAYSGPIDREEVLESLGRQATDLYPQFDIRVVMLDISRPTN